jgi:hypothetical protein
MAGGALIGLARPSWPPAPAPNTSFASPRVLVTPAEGIQPVRPSGVTRVLLFAVALIGAYQVAAQRAVTTGRDHLLSRAFLANTGTDLATNTRPVPAEA